MNIEVKTNKVDRNRRLLADYLFISLNLINEMLICFTKNSKGLTGDLQSPLLSGVLAV